MSRANDLIAYRGATVSWTITVDDDDTGARQDLTGAVIEFQVKVRAGDADPPLIFLYVGSGITILPQTGDTLGQATITVPAAATAELDAGRYAYDIVAELDGERRMLVSPAKFELREVVNFLDTEDPLIVVRRYSALTGLPDPSLVPPTWAEYFDALSDVASAGPAFAPLGFGRWGVRVPRTKTGFIDFGVGADRRYGFVPPDIVDVVVFPAFTPAGVPLPGLTPPFNDYGHAETGVEILPQPTVQEVGGAGQSGIYRVTVASFATGAVDLGPAVASSSRFVQVDGSEVA